MRTKCDRCLIASTLTSCHCRNASATNRKSQLSSSTKNCRTTRSSVSLKNRTSLPSSRASLKGLNQLRIVTLKLLHLKSRLLKKLPNSRTHLKSWWSDWNNCKVHRRHLNLKWSKNSIKWQRCLATLSLSKGKVSRLKRASYRRPKN